MMLWPEEERKEVDAGTYVLVPGDDGAIVLLSEPTVNLVLSQVGQINAVGLGTCEDACPFLGRIDGDPTVHVL